MKLYKLLTILFLFLIASCSETYESYNVNPTYSTSYSITVEASKWNLASFSLQKVENAASGDTARFTCMEIQAMDKSFPYPKKLMVKFYFDQEGERMSITPELTNDGLLSNIELIEIDIATEYVMSDFVIDQASTFVPELTVFGINKKYNTFSGTIEGAIHEKNRSDKRSIKIDFTNIYIK